MITQLTRTWDDKRERDMSNKKPFRTKEQKRRAKNVAKRRSDGAYRCNVEITLHPVSNQPLREYK